MSTKKNTTAALGSEQAPPIPNKQIRARQPTPDTIVVYQAHSVEIAEAAIAQQQLDASDAFLVGRMAWINPSFFSMMHRSEWSYRNERRARILQITMTKAGFLTLLEQATPAEGDIRYQWNPERNIRLEKLPHKTLLIGITGDMVNRWINEWIVDITDITDKVRRWKGFVDTGKEGVRRAKREIAAVWKEDVFEISQELEASLGMRSSEEEEE